VYSVFKNDEFTNLNEDRIRLSWSSTFGGMMILAAEIEENISTYR
jgi:hypothetical protein